MGIHGLEIIDMTAKVDPNTDMIIEYRAGVKISFGVEHESCNHCDKFLKGTII
jgi:hypothetical protein